MHHRSIYMVPELLSKTKSQVSIGLTHIGKWESKRLEMQLLQTNSIFSTQEGISEDILLPSDNISKGINTQIHFFVESSFAI